MNQRLIVTFTVLVDRESVYSDDKFQLITITEHTINKTLQPLQTHFIRQKSRSHFVIVTKNISLRLQNNLCSIHSIRFYWS